MSSFSSETLHPRARSAPFPSRLCLHRRGSPQTIGQMGTATTYSTARLVASCGTSCVLSDCVHNLSRGGSGQRRGTVRIHSSATWAYTGRHQRCCEHIMSGETPLGLRHVRTMSSQHPRPGPSHCSSTVEDQRLTREGECSQLKNPSLVNAQRTARTRTVPRYHFDSHVDPITCT